MKDKKGEEEEGENNIKMTPRPGPVPFYLHPTTTPFYLVNLVEDNI